MSEIITRNPRIDEIPALRHIWETAFGGSDEALFFDHYFAVDMCITAVSGDIPASAGYLLPAGNLIIGGKAVPCATIYAVATLPESRGCGFGAAVVRELINTGHSSAYPAIALCPSDDGLFGYYGSRTDLRDWFYVSEQRFDKAPSFSEHTKLTLISDDEYGRLREKLLDGTPHIEPDKRALSYQRRLCGLLGGGLFRVDTPGGFYCAVVEVQSDGEVWIKELLTPRCGRSEAVVTCALAAIAEAFPAGAYVVRIPARHGVSRSTIQYSQLPNHEPLESGNKSGADRLLGHDIGFVSRRFGMLALRPGMIDTACIDNTAPWYGLAYD